MERVMTTARAAEVLRGVGRKPHVLTEAERQAVPMGADALELLHWQAEAKAHVTHQSGRWRCSVGWFTSVDGTSPTEVLQKARAEWEKERKG